MIQNKNILKDIHKRYIMYQLLLATMYMHSGNVIHRDQKVNTINLIFLFFIIFEFEEDILIL